VGADGCTDWGMSLCPHSANRREAESVLVAVFHLRSPARRCTSMAGRPCRTLPFFPARHALSSLSSTVTVSEPLEPRKLVTMGPPNPVPWMDDLHRSEVAIVLSHFRGHLPRELVESVVKRTPTFEAHFLIESLDQDGAPRWQLRRDVAEEIEDQRTRLDAWWSNLSAEGKQALTSQQDGKFPGFYLEDVEKLSLVKPFDTEGHDLRERFRLPLLIRGYLLTNPV
jgi:hypothetical protein